MKFGIDLRPLQTGHQYRGIGIYTQNVTEMMIALAPEDQFVLFIYADRPKPELSLDSTNWEWRTIPGAPAVGLEREFIASFSYHIDADGHDLDAFLQPAIEFGLPRGCKTYCTMHDLIPLIFRKNYYPFAWPKTLRQLKRLIITAVNYTKYRVQLSHYRAFDGLIANSESTRKDTRRMLNYRKPIYLARLTGNAKILKPGPTSPSAKITEPFIVYIGANDQYKNVDALVESFRRLNLDDLQLVISGKEFGSRYPDVPGVVELTFASNEEIGWLLTHAEAYVHPALYEGFGMPTLEAMQSGCPVICYDNSSLPEVVGDAAIVLKTGEPFDEAILRIHNDPKLRAELKEKGLKRGALFSWERTARETLEVLRGTAHED